MKKIYPRVLCGSTKKQRMAIYSPEICVWGRNVLWMAILIELKNYFIVPLIRQSSFVMVKSFCFCLLASRFFFVRWSFVFIFPVNKATFLLITNLNRNGTNEARWILWFIYVWTVEMIYINVNRWRCRRPCWFTFFLFGLSLFFLSVGLIFVNVLINNEPTYNINSLKLYHHFALMIRNSEYSESKPFI